MVYNKKEAFHLGNQPNMAPLTCLLKVKVIFRKGHLSTEVMDDLVEDMTAS